MTVRMRVRMMKLLALPLFDSSASVTPCACVHTPHPHRVPRPPACNKGLHLVHPPQEDSLRLQRLNSINQISEPFLFANPAPQHALAGTESLSDPAKGPACHQNWGNLRREERLFTKIATKIMMAQPRSEGIKM